MKEKANVYFNSIKVRLKPLCVRRLARRYTNFNSIKVRLKQVLQRYDLLEEHHFNSIKVRLKPQIGELLPIFCEISIP